MLSSGTGGGYRGQRNHGTSRFLPDLIVFCKNKQNTSRKKCFSTKINCSAPAFHHITSPKRDRTRSVYSHNPSKSNTIRTRAFFHDFRPCTLRYERSYTCFRKTICRHDVLRAPCSSSLLNLPVFRDQLLKSLFRKIPGIGGSFGDAEQVFIQFAPFTSV